MFDSQNYSIYNKQKVKTYLILITTPHDKFGII